MIPTATDLANAILLFWKPGPWTDDDLAQWTACTKATEVTGHVLEGMALQILAAEVRVDLGPNADEPKGAI